MSHHSCSVGLRESIGTFPVNKQRAPFDLFALPCLLRTTSATPKKIFDNVIISFVFHARRRLKRDSRQSFSWCSFPQRETSKPLQSSLLLFFRWMFYASCLGQSQHRIFTTRFSWPKAFLITILWCLWESKLCNFSQNNSPLFWSRLFCLLYLATE